MKTQGLSLDQAPPLAIPMSFFLTAPFALAAAATVVLSPRAAPRWVALPVALTVAFSVTPALFPWRPSAVMGAFPAWVQLAEVGGQPLLDLCLTLGTCAAAAGALASPSSVVCATRPSCARSAAARAGTLLGGGLGCRRLRRRRFRCGGLRSRNFRRGSFLRLSLLGLTISPELLRGR